MKSTPPNAQKKSRRELPESGCFSAEEEIEGRTGPLMGRWALWHASPLRHLFSLSFPAGRSLEDKRVRRAGTGEETRAFSRKVWKNQGLRRELAGFYETFTTLSR